MDPQDGPPTRTKSLTKEKRMSINDAVLQSAYCDGSLSSHRNLCEFSEGGYSHVNGTGQLDYVGDVKFREEVPGCNHRRCEMDGNMRYGGRRHRVLDFG